MNKFNAICFLSSGKDSVFCLFYALFSGFDIKALIIDGQKDSLFFHYPNIKMAKIQCKIMNLKNESIKVKDKEFKEKIKNYLKKQKINAIFTGAIESDFQKLRFEEIANELNLRLYSPLWRHNLSNSQILNEFCDFFNIKITQVSADGLTINDIGNRFDEKFLKKIKKLNIHSFLEGGEAETLVLDAPFFNKKIDIEFKREKLSNTSFIMNILKYKIINKKN